MDIIQYNHLNKLEFEYDLIFKSDNKDFIKALIVYFKTNKYSKDFRDKYGDNIDKYHDTLMNILNIALINADK